MWWCGLSLKSRLHLFIFSSQFPSGNGLENLVQTRSYVFDPAQWSVLSVLQLDATRALKALASWPATRQFSLLRIDFYTYFFGSEAERIIPEAIKAFRRTDVLAQKAHVSVLIDEREEYALAVASSCAALLGPKGWLFTDHGDAFQLENMNISDRDFSTFWDH